jgi:archaemetzincin
MSVRKWWLLGCGCLAIGVAYCGRVALLGADDEDTGVPNPPDNSPALRAIRAAGDKIRPLHRDKTPPQPGEWLDKHPEAGQAFDGYRASDPNRPTRTRTTLYVQPIGTFTPAQKRLTSATADLLGRFYNLPVKTLEPIGLEMVPARARRVHPTWGDSQILSTHVLDLLKHRRPADAVAVLALTTSDLWPGEGWNFVYGQASLSERVGVWSLYREGDPETEYTTCLRRTLNTALHETGHMFGILHCTRYECCMNGSNNRTEADSRPMGFCPEDEMKIWWACQVEPVARYDRLAAFASAHGLDDLARSWSAAGAALRRGAAQP